MTARADDPAFTALPRALQRRIDNAFRRAIGEKSSRKRRKLDENGGYDQTSDNDSLGGGYVPLDPNALQGGFLQDEEGEVGGFIVDDEGGGFIPELSQAGPSTSAIPVDHRHDSQVQEGEGSSHADSHIPLSLVPTALQILDLPPDDEQVLLVFKNAASGWTSDPGSARRSSRGAVSTEEAVSLRDWRAVCSVLLAPDVEDGGVDVGMAEDEDAKMSAGDSEGSSEEYVESDPEGEHDEYPDDDNYSDTLAKRPTRRRSTRARKDFDESDSDIETRKNRPLTARQKETSRQAFSMFLSPSVDDDLENQRITISDLVRVSKELKENITYDQVRRLSPGFECLLTDEFRG